MENTNTKRVDAAGEEDTEKDAIALEVEEVVEAAEATTTTMEAEAAAEISMVIEEAAVSTTTLINSNITSLTFSNRHRPPSLCLAQWQQPMEPTRPSIMTAVPTPIVHHGGSSLSNNGRERPHLIQGIRIKNQVHWMEQETTTATLTPMATV